MDSELDKIERFIVEIDGGLRKLRLIRHRAHGLLERTRAVGRTIEERVRSLMGSEEPAPPSGDRPSTD